MSGSLPATGPPPLPPQPLTGRDPSCEDAADTSQPSPPATQQVVPGLSNIHQDRDRAACFFKSDHCLSLFGSSILLHSNSIHTPTAQSLHPKLCIFIWSSVKKLYFFANQKYTVGPVSPTPCHHYPAVSWTNKAPGRCDRAQLFHTQCGLVECAAR